MSRIAQHSALIIRFHYFKTLLTGFREILQKIEARTVRMEEAQDLVDPVFEQHIDALATLWYHNLNSLRDHMQAVHTILAAEKLIPPEAPTREQIHALITDLRLPLDTIKHRLETIEKTERAVKDIAERMDVLTEAAIVKTRYMKDGPQWYRRLNIGDRISKPYEVRDSRTGKWREGKQDLPRYRKAMNASTYRTPCDPPAGLEDLGKSPEEKLPPKFADINAPPFTPAQLEYLKNSFAPAPPTAQTVDPFTLSKQRFNAAIEWMKQNPTRGTQNVTFEIQDDPTPKETPAEKEERENEECRLATVAACQNQEALITRPATAESITQAPVSITPQKDTRGKMDERIARLIDNADRVTTFLQDVRYPLGSVRQIADVSFSETTLQGFDDLQKRADFLLAAINEGLPQPTEISVRMQQKETEILNFLRSLIRPDSGISLQTLNQFPDVKAVFEEISQTAYQIISFIERD